LTDSDISDCRRFGKATKNALNDPERLSPARLFEGLNPAPVNAILASVERVTHLIMHIWAKPIIKFGSPQSLLRKMVLSGSFIILYALIIVLAPLVLAINLACSWLYPGYIEQLKKRYTVGNRKANPRP
jgi:hypothetical protein